MYNILFTLKNIDLDNQIDFFRSQFDYVTNLPESRVVDDRILCQANVRSLNSIINGKQVLNSAGYDVDIIGVWQNHTGLKQGYRYSESGDIVRNVEFDIVAKELVNEPIHYPFFLEKYSEALADIVTFDLNGNEIERRRPLLHEASSIQMNHFAGMPARDLASYNIFVDEFGEPMVDEFGNPMIDSSGG